MGIGVSCLMLRRGVKDATIHNPPTGRMIYREYYTAVIEK